MKILFLILSLGSWSSRYEKAAESVVPILQKNLANEIILKEVEKNNKVKETHEEALAKDLIWVNGNSKIKWIHSLFKNPCSQYLKDFMKTNSFIKEIFVMNNVGGIVCLTSRTTDYYQGDERKWKIPFNEGIVDIGKVKFDESTKEFVLQISIPLKRKSKIIGAVTVSYDVKGLR